MLHPAIGAQSTGLTTPGAYQPIMVGGSDAYLATFDPMRAPANQLLYCTNLGGTNRGDEGVQPGRFDAMGNLVVAGATPSPSFPTTPGAFQRTYGGGASDLYVARLTLLPIGAERYRASTPACRWPIWQGVDSQPTRGNLTFTLHARGAPPDAAGALILGVRIPAFPFLNAEGLVNPITGTAVMAGGTGRARQLLRILPGVPPGSNFAAQWVFPTSARCPGTGWFSNSEGLELVVQ